MVDFLYQFLIVAVIFFAGFWIGCKVGKTAGDSKHTMKHEVD